MLPYGWLAKSLSWEQGTPVQEQFFGGRKKNLKNERSIQGQSFGDEKNLEKLKIHFQTNLGTLLTSISDCAV